MSTDRSISLKCPSLTAQQILAEGFGAADTFDPLTGSYYVESLTDELETGDRRSSGADRRRRSNTNSHREPVGAATDSGRGVRALA